MSFAFPGLSAPLLQAITEQAYHTPTPVQLQAIPAVLAGKDVMAAAQTGTGKTAAFVLPILELLSRQSNQGQKVGSNQVSALILAPTRELAVQIADSVQAFAKHTSLSSAVVYGGVKINPQMMSLRKGCDVLVATPGRLLDLYQQNAVRLHQLDILVLDEADRMLDLGFSNEMQKILSLLPVKRQSLLFSATFSAEIRKLAKTLLNHPVEISVSPANSAAKAIQQWVYPVDKKRKPALLSYLIEQHKWQQVLVFCKTRQGTEKLTRHLLASGIKAAAIHGDKSQGARNKALADFKNAEVQLLVATDIAARGLDIEQLPQVVNFDLPTVAEHYIHRIGRTARAGASGLAVSLVSADEIELLEDIEDLLNQLLPRKLIDGFEPRHDLPAARSSTRVLKAKKPKKPKKPKITANDTASNETIKTPAKTPAGKIRSRQNNNNQSKNNQNKSSQKKSQGRNNKKHRGTAGKTGSRGNSGGSAS